VHNLGLLEVFTKPISSVLRRHYAVTFASRNAEYAALFCSKTYLFVLPWRRKMMSLCKKEDCCHELNFLEEYPLKSTSSLCRFRLYPLVWLLCDSLLTEGQSSPHTCNSPDSSHLQATYLFYKLRVWAPAFWLTTGNELEELFSLDSQEFETVHHFLHWIPTATAQLHFGFTNVKDKSYSNKDMRETAHEQLQSNWSMRILKLFILSILNQYFRLLHHLNAHAVHMTAQ
jgi:hypothetical protein